PSTSATASWPTWPGRGRPASPRCTTTRSASATATATATPPPSPSWWAWGRPPEPRARRAASRLGRVELLGDALVGVEDQEAVEGAHEPAVVGDRQHGALVAGEALLQRLGR